MRVRKALKGSKVQASGESSKSKIKGQESQPTVDVLLRKRCVSNAVRSSRIKRLHFVAQLGSTTFGLFTPTLNQGQLPTELSVLYHTLLGEYPPHP